MCIPSIVIPGLGDKEVRLSPVNHGRGDRSGPLRWGKRAFLCLEMTPHPPRQPIRPTAGTG